MEYSGFKNEYHSKYVNIYQGDCMELLRQTPDKYYSLSIVDPPYGIGASKGTWGSSNKCKITNYGKKKWDSISPDKEYFNELMRISKNQIIFGANHFISKMPFDSSCWIVWDKDNTGYFADCELAWASFNTSVGKFKFRWNGMLQENMKNKETRIHPTQKPVALYKWILDTYAKEGQTILDTHLGSGSSAIAAHDYGYEFTGIELDKEYYDNALSRITEHQRQLTIF